MDEGERLIGQLHRSRAAMQRALSAVDAKMEIYPGWTVREILIHIAGWGEVGAAAVRAHIVGDAPAPLKVRGIDAYNAYVIERCKALTHKEAIEYWMQARRQLVDALDKMPQVKFADRIVYPWGETGDVARLVSILDEHEWEHAAEIMGMLSPGSDEEDN